MLTRIYGTAFHDQQAARRAPRAARAGEAARPSQARPRARPVHAAPRGAGDALLAAQRQRPAGADGGRGARAAAQARLRGDQDARGPGRGALAPLRALGQLQGEHVLHRVRGTPLRPEADELPGRLRGLRLARGTPTASCRCAWPSSARSSETSARASCTGCCGCARSPRTTRTSTAPRSRSPPRWWTSSRRSTSSTRASASPTSSSSSPPARRSRSAPHEQWERAEAALKEALEQHGARLPAEPRRRRLLRPQDRLPRHRRARAARGSSAPASSTSSCPSASTSPTPAPTTPSTAR